MFRDESSKVMQKAHAQWGQEDSDSTSPDPPIDEPVRSLSVSSISSPKGRRNSARSASSLQDDQVLPTATADSQTEYESLAVVLAQLSKPIGPSLEQQGVQFYVNRYLLGHPDEPRSPNDLDSNAWLWSPALQDVMTAVGLASLSNLRQDPQLMATARQKYGTALRQTGQLIQTCKTPSLMLTMRAVVMLVMFEVC